MMQSSPKSYQRGSGNMRVANCIMRKWECDKFKTAFCCLDWGPYIKELHVVNLNSVLFFFSEGKNVITKKDERAPEEKTESSNSHHPRPAAYKPDVKFGEGRGRGIRKAFEDAGIGINTKLGLKKMAVSSGSLSRDVSDEGASLLKRQPIEAEKCKYIL